MDVLVFALSLLSVVGCVWTTVHTVLEYRQDRLADFDELLKRVCHEDVYQQYVLRILTARLRDFQNRMFAPGQCPRNVSGRTLLAGFRGAIVLTPEETEIYHTLCIESLRRQQHCFPRAYIKLRVADQCSDYMWRTTLLQDLWEYLLQIHTN